MAGVFTASDLGLRAAGPLPGVAPAMAQPPLATDVVRYVGEPVVAVVATSAAAAADAADAVAVTYEPLAAVLDVDEAMATGAPLLFPDHGTNVAATWPAETCGTWRDGAVVVRGSFVVPRVCVAPMEGHAALAAPGPDGGMTMWVSTQLPHRTREVVAAAIGLDPSRLRVVAPRVGGGFGGKTGGGLAGHAVSAAVALRLGRPVRWTEDRAANLIEMQGRGCTTGSRPTPPPTAGWSACGSLCAATPAATRGSAPSNPGR